MGQQLQLEERQRVEPLVDEEQHQQAGAAAKQHRDQRRIEPVQARALGQAQHQHHQCRQPQGQAHAVELGKALQAHRNGTICQNANCQPACSTHSAASGVPMLGPNVAVSA
ncbi:hypothetical protein G6F61_014113 [Rhizopus arrhizus]|nr:hypothetical protein G6F61_014113 [Rhizopus arrhizus]